jgi:hypothetical protein
MGIGVLQSICGAASDEQRINLNLGLAAIYAQTWRDGPANRSSVTGR